MVTFIFTSEKGAVSIPGELVTALRDVAGQARVDFEMAFTFLSDGGYRYSVKGSIAGERQIRMYLDVRDVVLGLVDEKVFGKKPEKKLPF